LGVPARKRSVGCRKVAGRLNKGDKSTQQNKM